MVVRAQRSRGQQSERFEFQHLILVSGVLRETIQTAFFFSELCPFFNLDLILYQATHRQALAPACVALVSYPDKEVIVEKYRKRRRYC